MNTETYFFAPPDAISGDRIVLPPEEARHAVRVLRMKAGDEIVVVDGEGGWYHVVLDHIDKQHATGRIVERRQDVGEPSFWLTVAIGLLKNLNRFELFLEKAAELGVSEVVPLRTAFSENTRIKSQRATGILIAAMKQSRRSRMVNLAELQSFDAFVRSRTPDVRLICHEDPVVKKSILSELKRAGKSGEVCILVGPEGGFSGEEVALASKLGYEAVSLGPRRLRAETAAIAASTAVLLTLSD